MLKEISISIDDEYNATELFKIITLLDDKTKEKLFYMSQGILFAENFKKSS